MYAVFGVENNDVEETMLDVLNRTINAHRDTTAIEGTDGALSYGQLAHRLDSEVLRLRAAGVGRGDRVGIRVPSGTTDLYVAILATISAGAAYVPVDWDETESRAETVWEEAGVVVVYGADLTMEIRRSNEPDESQPTPDDAVWVIFTSGTTGKPKGVEVSHRSAAAWIAAENRIYLSGAPLRPADRVMAGLSVAFDASCEEMWLAWSNGSTLVAAERNLVRSGADLGKWIVEKQISAVSTVPTLAAMWEPESLGAVRLLIFGGEACPQQLIEKLAAPGREIWNTYGPTETTVIATGQLMVPGEQVRIGRPIPGWRLAVVDEEGVPVPWGETGELVVSGIGLGRYLDPELDADKYAPLKALGWSRCYRTGDLVRAEREGLVFAGRGDDQIKLGGRRLELGEIDSYLSEVPGVDAGAAALRKTAAGNSVLVGYLSGKNPGDIDLDLARTLLSARMPKGVVPLFCVLDELPMKTSGKVDRKLLPWPLPETSGTAGTSALPERYAHLQRLWAEQLGPVQLTPESNFFDLGGGSVPVALLTARIRETHPGAEIGELYQRPTLAEMADYLDHLQPAGGQRRMPRRIPQLSAAFQTIWVLFLYLINAVRFTVGALIAVWILEGLFDAGWVPHIDGLPLIAAWILLYSLPGKVLLTAAIIRPLTLGITPGRYLRGGWTHLRLWAAQRTLVFMQLDNINGTPFAPTMHRLLGSKVGRDCHLEHAPSVTGLLSIGRGAVIEHEADLEGYWIDGDSVFVDRITIGEGARIGTRSIVQPGVEVGRYAEILPGSNVDRNIGDSECWAGSPLSRVGEVGSTWPRIAADRRSRKERLNVFQQFIAYSGGLLILRVLQILAMLPGFMVVYPNVAYLQRYEEVFPILFLWVPVFTILMVITWLTGVVVVVRVAAVVIAPGFYPVHSLTGWAVWLTHTVLQRTLISTYPIYASSFTPIWMRILGARVGRDVEISTIETIPHLTWIKDRSFLADHSLINCTRMYRGWLHVGTSVVGEGSFVGNSGIVGPDRDVSDGSLVAVLSSAPHHPRAGSSWLGRSPRSIPRLNVEGESSLTYRPPTRLKVLRLLVESCRILPAIISNWLDLLTVYVLTMVYMHYWLAGEGAVKALTVAALWSWPVVLGAGICASLVPVAVKWLLIGRFRVRNAPLFSSLVWRGELLDVFVESLAVPALIRMSLGTPMLNVWHRLMGSHIGRSVWCETWWLPEYDLIVIGDGATVNRGTVLQTHLFHDRVMSMQPVHMQQGSTLGPNSFILPGADLGSCSTVGPASLVQRGEILPDNSVWQGNPVRYRPGSGRHLLGDQAPESTTGDRFNERTADLS
nr:Pls/PosA family non-ribosomal peptide synthetase [Corynebacterium pacaense]